jgi:hypothetical protein
MTANWKEASKILPERRIRVITCDKLGFIQTGFYGHPSRPQNLGQIAKETWWSDDIHDEREIEVVWWDDFPRNANKTTRAV